MRLSINWNPGDDMSKEFALTAIEDIKNFYRRLYHFPGKKPFDGSGDFESAMQMLNGLSDFIETAIMD